MGKVSFEIGLLSSLLAWQEKNSASAEEAAVYFLTTQSDVWSAWVNDDARAKLSAFIK
jgi:glycine betaine/proline transport system substrate-binding protein